MIYETVTRLAFADKLSHAFSYEGAGLLYNFLDDDLHDIKFNRNEICSEWSEYTASDLISDYGYLLPDIDVPENSSDSDIAEAMADVLEKRTTVLRDSDKGIYVVGNF